MTKEITDSKEKQEILKKKGELFIAFWRPTGCAKECKGQVQFLRSVER